MQNCKIGTTLMTSSSSGVAWKMTVPKRQLNFVTFKFKQFKPKNENKMSAILIHYEIMPMQYTEIFKVVKSETFQ